MASALPLVLRHDAVDLEAPPRDGRAGSLAAALDLFALFGVLFIDPVFIGTVWAIYLALQLATAAYALRLDGESLRPLWALPLQQFAYRQIMYLVVIQSVISAASGVRLRWHKLHRTGDLTSAAIPEQVAHSEDTLSATFSAL